MRFWYLRLLYFFCASSFPFSGSLNAALTSDCPPQYFLKKDGACFYDFPYLRDSRHGFAKRIIPSKDGFSPKVIHLGKILFFDPILSRNHTVSCASCHSPQRHFSDGLARSRGISGLTNRSAPSLWNVAFSPALFWDGRSATLEEQLEGPLLSPLEMGTTREKVVQDLSNSPEYLTLFEEAFGDRQITFEKVALSIATFERTLLSLQSPYDRYLQGEETALTKAQVRGLNVFRSFVTRCTECHEPPLFTNFQAAVIGAPELSGLTFDIGIEKLFPDRRNRGAFRIPSLRNITETAPYMHSGAFSRLEEVVDFYDQGGGRAKPPIRGLFVHWHIRPMGITVQEKADLIAFLASLTDNSGIPETPARVPSGLAGDHL